MLICIPGYQRAKVFRNSSFSCGPQKLGLVTFLLGNRAAVPSRMFVLKIAVNGYGLLVGGHCELVCGYTRMLKTMPKTMLSFPNIRILGNDRRPTPGAGTRRRGGIMRLQHQVRS